MTTTIRLVGTARNAKDRFVTRNLGHAEDMADAREQAAGFLSDPRDTIETVHFFEVRRQRFNGWLTREGLRKTPQP